MRYHCADEEGRAIVPSIMQFTSARELFESAREASRDAERIRRQLLAMEHSATGLAGSGMEPRVRSTGEPDRMASRVASMVDREGLLRERIEWDYRLIDFANEVLYGMDGRSGLWALVGWRADALALHYLNDLTWSVTGSLLGYSEQYVWQQAQVALDTADAWGLASVIDGMGGAEG